MACGIISSSDSEMDNVVDEEELMHEEEGDLLEEEGDLWEEEGDLWELEGDLLGDYQIRGDMDI